jgi:hypothetical protein
MIKMSKNKKVYKKRAPSRSYPEGALYNSKI